ncbi:MAG TPA: hypothetical protein VF797_15680 [Noviherbaspirillum sp.]
MRGIGSAPTTSANTFEGVTGFMNAAFGLLSFFAAVAMNYSKVQSYKSAKPRVQWIRRGFALQAPEKPERREFYPTSPGLHNRHGLAIP